MGCCSNSPPYKDQVNLKLIFDCILQKKTKFFNKLFSDQNSNQQAYLFYLNNELGQYNTLTVNTLGLCLIIGDYEAFTFFHRLGCEIYYMEKLLNKQGLTSLEIICMKGYSKLLSYYLPFYKEYLEKHPKKELNSEFQLSVQFKPHPENRFSPIQLATIFEHIQIITVLYQDVKDKKQVLQEIDLEHVEEKSGLNCALLAVKSGNFSMVKYLHSNYSCNFGVVDVNGNNAIEIALVEKQRKPFKDYLKIIRFLINVVGLDVKGDIAEFANGVSIRELETSNCENEGSVMNQ